MNKGKHHQPQTDTDYNSQANWERKLFTGRCECVCVCEGVHVCALMRAGMCIRECDTQVYISPTRAHLFNY